MKKAGVALAVALCSQALPAVAQVASEAPHPISTWSMHSPDVMIAGRTVYPLAVFTPPASIVVRRVEALSNSGPVKGKLANGELIPCPVVYTLELSNGTTTQVVPISNTLLNKSSSQTYTDSGPISVPFEGQQRITVTMLPPKPQFPPVNCSVEGLNITVQYEALQAPAAQSSDADADKQ